MSATRGVVPFLSIAISQILGKAHLITFRGNNVDILLPSTTSVDTISEKLEIVPIDGKILLGNGFLFDFFAMIQVCSKNQKTKLFMISISDGKVSVNISGEKPMKEIGKNRKKCMNRRFHQLCLILMEDCSLMDLSENLLKNLV
ncbi:MAG: hypothetical protein LBH02_03050 [Methanocalculaceae archaeon]|jgi:Mg-chelatase subunit ChlD|nr:hypothetical protein [Methanocalculaceae archaeon]